MTLKEIRLKLKREMGIKYYWYVLKKLFDFDVQYQKHIVKKIEYHTKKTKYYENKLKNL